MSLRCGLILLSIIYLHDSALVRGAPLAGTDPRYMPDMETSLAVIVRNYVKMETEKLEILTRQAESLEARSLAHNDEEINPIAMYRAVESLFDEWTSLYETMNSTSLQSVLTPNLPTPKFQDLTEVARALFRVQDVYQLSETDVASGTVAGMDTSGSFSARDCYNLGGMAFTNNDQYHALMWFQEALARLPREDPPTIGKTEILPVLVIALNRKGNPQRAKRLAVEFEKKASKEKFDQVIALYPEFKTILDEAAKDEWLAIEDPPALKNDRLDWFDTTEQPKYEFLCRQEYKGEIPVANSSFYCYYDRTSPYLRLAPAKVEIMSLEPSAKLYRNAISDEEIAVIKRIVRAKLDHSRVVQMNVTGIVLSSARESFTGWLRDEEDAVVARVRRRAGLITQLYMKSAEDLQISQYSIGGHYGPHYDHATKEDRSKPGFFGSYNNRTGDRIATLMFYLSEPKHGGGTAFPYANLVVQPSKNDAIFWYNLRPSGNGDYNTLHAGCPIISGSKWVANQWIKERGQEFVRRCNLIEN